ncbi:MAG TPA: choice-of-anchor Q domain-containing protein [Candidatus Binataceae bacterium]|nr:choice-of-anchor Q domain-containing protein [Candidatus Binataceae bacterium]
MRRKQQLKTNIWRGIFAAALIGATAMPVHAASFVVTNDFDSGAGSLREAIILADISPDPVSSITFAAALAGKTIILDSPLPAVGTTLSITGPTTSSSGITIDANHLHQIGLVTETASLTVTYVTLANGVVDHDFEGGAIENDGELTVIKSTFRNNRGGFGGAIGNIGGELTLVESTFTDNVARQGGDVFGSGTIDVTNCTFSGSSADGTGGSFLIAGGSLRVTNSTFTRDIGGGFGGAIGVLLGSVELKATLLADNSNGSCAAPDENVITDEGYNRSDDATCKFTQSTSINNATGLKLDPQGLHNNGGPTETVALLEGSTASDQIPVADCTDLASGDPITTDQRGEPRPDPEDLPGGRCDIGAYEFQQPASPIDCSNAAASAPNLVALAPVFFPEQITGVVDTTGGYKISVTSVDQSKPIPGFPQCPNATVVGATTFIRTTSQGAGGLLYSIGFTATDKSTSASCTRTVPVCVQDFAHRGEPCTGATIYDATRCR